MRYLALALLILLHCLCGWSAEEILLEEQFTDDGLGTRYTADMFDAGNDFFRWNASVNAASFGNPAGSNPISGGDGGAWVSEDTGAVRALTLSNAADISEHHDLRVSIAMGPARYGDPRFEGPDYGGPTSDKIEMHISLDGGPYQVIGRFLPKNYFPGNQQSELYVDADLNNVIGVGETQVVTSTMTVFSFPVSGSGSSLRLRVVFLKPKDQKRSPSTTSAYTVPLPLPSPPLWPTSKQRISPTPRATARRA